MSSELDLFFVGSADKEFESDLSQAAQEKFATVFTMMIAGLKPPLSDSKPLNGLGKGVYELRKNGRPAYRCVYVVKDGTLYVLHAFSKTSGGTPKSHEETIKKRYKSIK
ncbi:TPA: type II toxin-antitoxin system RelE/ParE family toxin [Escherichia coli]|uniref:type II toxin-antitoxin system RelE/ParE family toxin n=2 Tax=Escherichia coli TaxID=562 RepID=UPI0006A0EED3|nr:type II toxin-antitoxin system RelE/ParE family toxin [Escherichia coli]EJE8221395.1 type II toxin-antitoxin system RelE/ParE family toxin [Escherichia coli]EJE8395691.1 type II toxin-antitoxin system RelE/ParE family toxin [Escherichia coli]MDN0523000.1 type II toxin-antitoxin system RelE/ParE family toxin [Escherichia coli]MDN0574597.1 type II toxin-antitoxin system RelE/ParE family toxin [Escherichia coli]MDS0913591.1 type II toxin-antitoxin system RelE/ParE family toxin [Escherichia col